MTLILLLLLGAIAQAAPAVKTITSPDGRLVLGIDTLGGRVFYSISYADKVIIQKSVLGLKADIGDFSSNLSFLESEEKRIAHHYTMRGTKASEVRYEANRLTLKMENVGKRRMDILFNVSNNDVAFCYTFPQTDATSCMVVKEECTAFIFPSQTTTFLCPQAPAMSGWKRTKPSYEEEYTPDAPMNQISRYGEGYTFPCLFRIGTDGWALVSETGVDGGYVGSHLSDYRYKEGYKLAFPMEQENNGLGSACAGISLPGATPWRTITVGETLKPIVETTIPFDVVEEKYKASEDYKPGRYVWSWLIWQDASINYEDQIQFINLAGKMDYEYVLVDGCWDQQIGREKVEELSRYARQKGVRLIMWYNSNGDKNDAPQTPKNCMNRAIRRKQEMAWLKSIGVKGIKVDFFAGDKQHTMQLYEDILSDANDFGLQVIFHGCTLPRGWERMFPNYASSEAVLASENTYFSSYHTQREGKQLTMHPFSRNAIGSMDWGGTIMNRYMSRDNKSRHPRLTSDMFEIATGIINQSSLQCIAIQPNNLTELPPLQIGLLRQIPASWDEVCFIDGYPMEYVVIARRKDNKWYIAGLNGTDKPMTLNISLPMLAGKDVSYYTDCNKVCNQPSEAKMQRLKICSNGKINITMQPLGGMVITENE